MASISTIVVGTALLLEGAAVTASFGRQGAQEAGGGLSAEVLGGISGIVLGILALIGIAPLVMVPVANIVFGTSLIMGAAMTTNINQSGSSGVVRQAVAGAASTQVMVGIAAVVLGILAVLNVTPLVLSLVSLLAVGTSVLLSGSAIGGRVVSFLGR